MRLTARMMIALAHPCNDLQTLISERVCGTPVQPCCCAAASFSLALAHRTCLCAEDRVIQHNRTKFVAAAGTVK